MLLIFAKGEREKSKKFVMPSAEHNVHHLKKHRNYLYGLVVLLLFLQIVSFFSISSQVAKVETGIVEVGKEIEKEKTKTEEVIKKNEAFYKKLLDDYNSQHQQNFNEITRVLSEQQTAQKSFEEQIQLLKSTQTDDFSAIIENSVKGVVSVGTDKSAATGFIINEEGYIVTNQHVIEDAKTIAVMTFDKNIISAKLIGEDENRDVALLKIDVEEGKEYPALELANFDSVQVGRKVIAIGNPLGLSFSVTEGIVSAVHRKGPNNLAEYIQTDVSLNRGNSGGPLIDNTGKVIGVNNFKVGDAEGLGFALESNSVREVVNKLAGKQIA